MQIHTVSLDDFSSNDYHVLGIHSPLEDYRLAYMLNLHLNLSFKRCLEDIDFKNETSKACYPLYEHIDSETDSDWFLISNVYKTYINTGNSSGLFSENQARIYLVPEKKKVDYFLKLEGEFNQNQIENIKQVIKEIPQIVTVYKIETDTLKSKEFLIF